MSQTIAPTHSTPPAPERDTDLSALAARYGLSVSGARPTLRQYVRELWSRRHFITTFATAKLTSQYSQAKLGQIWQIMTPLLNAVVYFFIFGVLLGTKRGVPDYIPFLVTGVFIWTYTSSSVTVGTRAISSNQGLVRALHFPRASLPLSLVLQQLQQLFFSMCALVVILVAFGQYPRFHWALAIPALLCQSLFCAGVSLIMARLGAKTPDIAQLMPFIVRVWMYTSGVMWSVEKLTSGHKGIPDWVVMALRCQPGAVYIDIMRFALIDSFHANQLPPHVWALCAGWGLLFFAGGFIYFWRAEESYGRG
ncbi:ABC transporter permease [Streptomyces sp. NBC_01497]|uniref:ABC transporter permease n=1 Tax=Streptomyces sp. NBC_01497 TaxID=2903885 RepID=UPI002E32D8BE|nr:ABC transporter permease [Streptomyces sp. NBC_01497]